MKRRMSMTMMSSQNKIEMLYKLYIVTVTPNLCSV